MLGPHDVGKRVVVRRIVDSQGPRPVFSDILGHLVAASETHFTLRTRTGEVQVPKREIARAKTVPDRRRPTATEALEIAAVAGWPPRERAELGDWILRATDGWTMRGNSALPVGDPGMPVEAAVDAVAAWYRERGLPPAVSVPLPLFHRLDDLLDGRGWQARPISMVMTAPIAVLAAHDDDAHLDPEPSPHWIASVGGRKGPLPAVALPVLTGVPEVRFASVYGQSGQLLATGRGCVADPDGRWLGLSLIGTDESARRRGLARRVVGALAAWAALIGARDAYLQVEEHNTAAVALYAKLGFGVHHVYCSRVLSV